MEIPLHAEPVISKLGKNIFWLPVEFYSFSSVHKKKIAMTS